MRQSPGAHDSGDGVITTSYLRQPLRRRRRSHRRQEERNKTNTPGHKGHEESFCVWVPVFGARCPKLVPCAKGERKFLSPARGGEVRSVGGPLAAGCSLGTSLETSMG